jgi:hypothetical protein
MAPDSADKEDRTGRVGALRYVTAVTWVSAVLVTGAGVILSLLAAAVDPEHLVSVLWLTMATLGAVISVKVPDNPIGWLLLGVGALFGVRTLAAGFADLALLADTGSRSWGVVSGMVSHVLWVPITFIPLTIVLLLIPDGHLPSRRWRIVIWLAIVGMASTAATVGLAPDIQGDMPRWPVENPWALDEGSLIMSLLQFGFLVLVVSMIGAAASLVIRYRQATDVVRQQVKWIAYGCGLAAPLWIVFGSLFDETLIGGIGTIAAFTLFALSIVVAILRHRLYDIDRIISRTVTYTLVAGLLALVYGVIAVGLPQLSGTTRNSSLAVAAATLAVAALFNPLRRRAQSLVDQRFNRHRYDAQKEIEKFGNRLRMDIDIDGLTTDWIEVVRETMQPVTVGVWIRDDDYGPN